MENWTSLKTALSGTGYIASDSLAMALHIALSLGRPILLEGAAGVGKTDIARSLSEVKNCALIRLQCYEGLDAAQAIYEWNYQRQLLSIRAAAEDGETGRSIEARIFSEDYLLERPLLKAIRCQTPPVLLIDEIDRADEEFEAYLLEILSEFQITVPELGTIKALSRFAASDPGPAARVSGFVAHLRDNGFRIGVAETNTALSALCKVNASNPRDARLALKAVCAGSADDVAQFDLLFDSFWLNEGRVRQKIIKDAQHEQPKYSRSTKEDKTRETSGRGAIHAPDDSNDQGESDAEGTGRLIASHMRNLMKKDLRELVGPDDIYAAEQVARRLGKALHDRRSRRRKLAQKGQMIDLRSTLRQSLSTGGEPLRLAKRKRPDRASKIVALCDVSGSMIHYARPFLAFLAGLMRADKNSDAYMFHTRLVRVTEALRDNDPLRSLNRITLLADGFGGGSKIGRNLQDFARGYARKFVNGRSVVMIFSDGYDRDRPEILAAALAKLKKRGCKIIWLNPLKGWAGYAPIAGGMAAALPYLDHFAPASTLNDLADLEKRFLML